MKEKWRKIRGFNGRYEVSNIGRVRNLGHRCKSSESNIMTPFMTTGASGGYLRIALVCKDGKPRKFQVHQLVCKAFIPNPERKPHVNHLNAIRFDNRVENLEWCTPKENTAHAISIGRRHPPKGEKNKASKLKESQVVEIKKQLHEGEISMYRIAKNYGVHKVTIFDIKYGNTWKHIQ